MSIRSILTSFTGTGGGRAALHMSLLMARKYDATLTAALWQPQNPLRRRSAAFLSRDIDTVLDTTEAQFVEERRAQFTAQVDAAGLGDMAEFIVLDQKPGSLSEEARGHDIVVMGSNRKGEGAVDFAVRPDVVALRSGRPVLIVPQDYDLPAIRETAVVAWDGKRAAARALADAMHILGTKEKVTLLCVGSELDRSVELALNLLSVHGIEADVVQRPVASGGIGKTILDTCAELGSGMLIMGAYEHSKFAEDLLGGTTQDILSQATIPVLMSH